ncbi:MAG TPA: ABC transporter permease [Thermoanaerobaculia bacterium]|nr:ABC transporter permease [Thermoanaerobaculia bacterium]
MFFRILANSFRRSRRRKTIAFIALAIASAVWTLVLAIGAGMGDRTRRDLTAYGANIVVLPETAQASPSILGAPLPAPPSPQALPEAALDAFPDLFWKNNITAISPVLETAAAADGTPTLVEGVDFRRGRRTPKGEAFETGVLGAHPAWKIARGRWPRDGAPEAAAGIRLSESRGWTEGARLSLRGPGGAREAVLAGIFRSGEREDDVLLLPLADTQALAGAPGRIGRIDVTAMTTPESKIEAALHRDPKKLAPAEYDRWYCTPYASSIAAQIGEAIPGARAAPLRRVTADEERSAGIAATLLFFAGAAALLAALLAVFSTLFDSVTERAPEIGLWKALGAEPEKIAAVFLAEAALNGLLGGVAGALTGFLAAPALARAVFGFDVPRTPLLAGVAVAAAVCVSVAASTVPVRRAIRLEPIRALREG